MNGQEIVNLQTSVEGLGKAVVPIGYFVAISLLCCLTSILVYQLIRELRTGDTPRIDSHWGGFGGGLGGWQLSRSLMYLLASLGFAILTVTALRNAAEDLKEDPPEPPQETRTVPDGAKPSAGTEGSGAPGSSGGAAGTR